MSVLVRNEIGTSLTTGGSTCLAECTSAVTINGRASKPSPPPAPAPPPPAPPPPPPPPDARWLNERGTMKTRCPPSKKCSRLRHASTLRAVAAMMSTRDTVPGSVAPSGSATTATPMSPSSPRPPSAIRAFMPRYPGCTMQISASVASSVVTSTTATPAAAVEVSSGTATRGHGSTQCGRVRATSTWWKYLMKSGRPIQNTPSSAPYGDSSARPTVSHSGEWSLQSPVHEPRPHGLRSWMRRLPRSSRTCSTA
mmetsp:Transcript_6786/g.24124  ORF Transcript_6786/g.24124 Transcript_6786/m.24124 type:complete len:253 (-) Transcript_6786:1564-2322(-)